MLLHMSMPITEIIGSSADKADAVLLDSYEGETVKWHKPGG